MNGGGFLNGIHGAAKAERARTAAIEEADQQVRSKTQAVATHRQVDNFERRVARLMPELLVERQEFIRPAQVLERLVGQSPADRANRNDIAPETARYAQPPASAPTAAARGLNDPFFSSPPPGQVAPPVPSAAPGYLPGPPAGEPQASRSDGFSNRDFDYERSLDARQLIGAVEEQQAGAASAALPLLEALDNGGQLPLADAARGFLEANTSYDLATGRNEVDIQKMIAQLNGVMPASMPEGPPRRAMNEAMIEAMSAALTVVAPSNGGEVSNALKLVFAPKEVFNVEAVSEATEAISSTPESEKHRIEEDRAKQHRDYVERIRREKKRKQRRLARDSEDSTVSGLFRR